MSEGASRDNCGQLSRIYILHMLIRMCNSHGYSKRRQCAVGRWNGRVDQAWEVIEPRKCFWMLFRPSSVKESHSDKAVVEVGEHADFRVKVHGLLQRNGGFNDFDMIFWVIQVDRVLYLD